MSRRRTRALGRREPDGGTRRLPQGARAPRRLRWLSSEKAAAENGGAASYACIRRNTYSGGGRGGERRWRLKGADDGGAAVDLRRGYDRVKARCSRGGVEGGGRRSSSSRTSSRRCAATSSVKLAPEKGGDRRRRGERGGGPHDLARGHAKPTSFVRRRVVRRPAAAPKPAHARAVAARWRTAVGGQPRRSGERSSSSRRTARGVGERKAADARRGGLRRAARAGGREACEAVTYA